MHSKKYRDATSGDEAARGKLAMGERHEAIRVVLFS